MTDPVIAHWLPEIGWLAFTPAELSAARARASAIGLGSNTAPAQAPVAGQQLLDSRAMGKRLGVGDTLLEQMARDGRVPCVRIGKYLRFDPAEVVSALRLGHADKGSSTHA